MIRENHESRFFVIGILVFIAVIAVVMQLFNKEWTNSWKTFVSEEYGFSFKYPSDWYIKPEIISMNEFNDKKRGIGDYQGFIFYVDSKNGTKYNSKHELVMNPGNVEISFVRYDIGSVIRDHRPENCSVVVKANSRLSCVGNFSSTTGVFDSLYLEGNNYVFSLYVRTNYENAGFFERGYRFIQHLKGRMVLNSFRLTK